MNAALAEGIRTAAGLDDAETSALRRANAVAAFGLARSGVTA